MTEQERKILSEYLGVPNWQTEFPIPEQFQAYLDACTREEHIIPTPNGTTKLWVFMPKKRSESKAAFLYFNGAAYCYPHADIHWCFCARIAAELGIPVVDGLYTLTSVAPFPANLNDCYACAKWTSEHAQELGFDPEKLVIGGDSSGGNLTFAVSLLAKERGEFPVMMQVLMYPESDMGTPVEELYPNETPSGLLFSRIMIEVVEDDPEKRKDPLISPYFATQEQLRGMPETCLYTCDQDSMRDRDSNLVYRMALADVPVSIRTYPGTHGFICRRRTGFDLAYMDIEYDIRSCEARRDAKKKYL